MIVANSDLPISSSIWTVGTHINGREIQFLIFPHTSPDPRTSQAKNRRALTSQNYDPRTLPEFGGAEPDLATVGSTD